MGNRIKMEGLRFGRLIVGKYSHTNKHRFLHYIVKCDCGKQKAVNGAQLRNGSIKSCGCLNKENVRLRSTKHGMHNIPT